MSHRTTSPRRPSPAPRRVPLSDHDREIAIVPRPAAPTPSTPSTPEQDVTHSKLANATAAARALLEGGDSGAAGLPRTPIGALHPEKIHGMPADELLRAAHDDGESDPTSDLLYGASVDLDVFAHATSSEAEASTSLSHEILQSMLLRVEHRVSVARELHARQLAAYRGALAGLVLALSGAGAS